MRMENDFAASSREERELLARIVANLSEAGPLQAYAAWLKDRDAQATPVVEALVPHLLEGGPRPQPVPHRSAAWHRLLGFGASRATGQSWAEATCDLSQEARHLVGTWMRPIVCMTPYKSNAAELPLGASRFQGAPDLPAEVEWPTCARGPLRFQAQIDLGEMAASVATIRYRLPEEGHLLLFAFDDDGESGIQPGVVERNAQGEWEEIPGLTHVAYVPAGRPLVRREIPPETAPCDGGDWMCRLVFSDGLDVPAAGDLEDEGDWEDLTDELRGGWTHKLMGYPVHGRTSNTSPGPEWLNLITLGSDDITGWCWADGEHLDVYVHGEGLASRSFRPFYGYAA